MVGGRMGRIDDLLVQIKERGASDLHLAAKLAPRMRENGTIQQIEGYPVYADEDLREALREIIDEDQWARYIEAGDLDHAYSIDGVGRFRVNYFTQENGAGAVFRLIPETIVPLEDLNVPDAIAGLAELERGFVLVTGPTGCGKSTTLASIIDRINRTKSKHIVTIEEPVEFVHSNRKSIFSHREVGKHTNSFANALRASIRQDADVILVGEMRDYETIALAMTAAEMGALVFGTLHATNAAKTLDRIIDAFPAAEQDQARISLSESISAVVSQLLLRTADGKGRCAATEILLRSAALPNVIREGNTPMITSLIQSGRDQGMQAMDDCLEGLVEEGRITLEDARHASLDKERFGGA